MQEGMASKEIGKPMGNSKRILKIWNDNNNV